MKTFDAGLTTHYADTSRTLACCMLVTRTDGAVFAFNDTDKVLSILGQDYVPGLKITATAQGAGLAVNNLELTIGYHELFIRADFLAGLWDGAIWEMFETNWRAPSEGSNTLGRFVTGTVQPGTLACKVELRAYASQRLQQPIGIATSKTCRARFADFPSPISSALCRLDPADWTVTGTLTEVTNQQVARDSTRTEAADWFGDGVFTFTSGANVSLSQKVKIHAADGTLTFSIPFPFGITVGDAYSLIAGCRKRHDRTTANPTGISDCIDKFDNVLNHYCPVKSRTKSTG